MEELIENLVWSVNSFINRENTKAEMARVLFNKKQRSSNDNEYTNTLITNIGYYTVLTSVTLDMMKQCFSNDIRPNSARIVEVVEFIQSKFNSEFYYNEVARNYIGADAKPTYGMGLIDKLEFDYVFYNFMVNLTQEFIKYFENGINDHSASKIQQYDHKSVVSIIDKEITKHTINFMDYYSPPKRYFAV